MSSRFLCKTQVNALLYARACAHTHTHTAGVAGFRANEMHSISEEQDVRMSSIHTALYEHRTLN